MEAIVTALGPLADRVVVEIGPGRGAITDLLAARAGRLLAIEFDPALASALRERYAAKSSVAIHSGDVLEFDFADAAREAGQPLLVVGNLPYYITSPILLHLAGYIASTAPSPAMETAVLMVQREVADRVTAEPGTRDYGLLTVQCALHGMATPLFTLPPEAFSPAPMVHSTVFRWNFSLRFDSLGLQHASDREKFSSLLRVAFAQKRKTLANNLRAAGFPANRISAALIDASIPQQARAEQLSLDQFAALHRALSAAQ